MFSKNLLKYLISLLLYALLLNGCGRQRRPELPVLNETFGRTDKSPFGTYIAYNRFRELFDSRFVETNKKPFDEAWKDMKEYSTNTKYSLYVLVTKNLSISNGEAEALLSFANEGNDLFIAADYIDDKLLSRINCNEERTNEIISEVGGLMKTTSVKVKGDGGSAVYKYFYYPFLNSFNGYDSSQMKVLGVNEIGQPDYAVFFLGKGRLYLHAAPRTFGNYFLLTKDNYQYLETVLSYLRPDPKNIFWDEHYKNKQLGENDRHKVRSENDKENKESFSTLGVVKKYPSLLSAFWISVAAILLFVLFNTKRKQRIISEIKPNENTTLVFTETVGRLYLQKRDNKNISEKMITYFYDHIRNRFFLNTAQPDERFITAVSRKSGLSKEDAEHLFTTINKIQAVEQVSDDELMLLNNQLQNFYKKK